MPSTDFHPDLRRFARFAPRAMIGPRSLRLIRALSGLQRSRSRDGIEALILGSGVGVRLHRPTVVSQPAPALLWIHGGGYIMGNAAQDDAVCRRFARELGITVAAVDHRLAPEHPYPAPLEDCYS
ncbi:MAG: alpha/beta hydrolase fold domain-containing protein, partial [Mycobacterium sp.]